LLPAALLQLSSQNHAATASVGASSCHNPCHVRGPTRAGNALRGWSGPLDRFRLRGCDQPGICFSSLDGALKVFHNRHVCGTAHRTGLPGHRRWRPKQEQRGGYPVVARCRWTFGLRGCSAVRDAKASGSRHERPIYLSEGRSGRRGRGWPARWRGRRGGAGSRRRRGAARPTSPPAALATQDGLDDSAPYGAHGAATEGTSGTVPRAGRGVFQ